MLWNSSPSNMWNKDWLLVRAIACVSSVLFASVTAGLVAACVHQEDVVETMTIAAVGSAILSVGLCLCFFAVDVDDFFFLRFFVVVASVGFGCPLGSQIIYDAVPSYVWTESALATLAYVVSTILTTCVIMWCGADEET